MDHQNIFLLIGSNIGDRIRQIQSGIQLIEKEIGTIKSRSKVYETAPWGKTDQPNFLNQAFLVASPLSPNELLLKIKSIEHAQGRTRVEKWGERTIDIDIIYFGNETINKSDLVIPHPHLAERKFFLFPLTQIIPEFIHPELQKSNAQLLKECNDTLLVKEFTS